MTQTRDFRVAISQHHAGQIVQPVVTATAAPGVDRVTVTLQRYDASDRTSTVAREFTGQTKDAEKWLTAEGVHLDAQGIH
jgi:hypothetical protein